MNIILVGLSHHVQGYGLEQPDVIIRARELELKTSFYEFLRRLLREYDVDFIAEEFKQGTRSIAEALAEEEEIGYSNVDLSLEERHALGIRREYATHRDAQAPIDIERWDRMRESKWVERIPTPEAGTAVFLCGRTHVESVCRLLEGRGDHVRVIDLRDEAWYLEDFLLFALGEE